MGDPIAETRTPASASMARNSASCGPVRSATLTDQALRSSRCVIDSAASVASCSRGSGEISSANPLSVTVPGGMGGGQPPMIGGVHGGSSPRLTETARPVRADSYTAQTISSASRPAWPSTAGSRPSSIAASRSAICAAWLATSIAAGSRRLR